MDNLNLRAQSCVSCKFFAASKTMSGMAECHRFPPQMTALALEIPENMRRPGEPPFQIQNVVGFTQVTEAMWCGEHKPRLDMASSRLPAKTDG